jgi:predicted nucleic acid-binding Zn ribbon protein
VLTVECESSTWANELTYLTPVILERLRADDPATTVTGLRFVVGRPHRPPDTDDE